jgi:hypothetical protein
MEICLHVLPWKRKTDSTVVISKDEKPGSYAVWPHIIYT